MTTRYGTPDRPSRDEATPEQIEEAAEAGRRAARAGCGDRYPFPPYASDDANRAYANAYINEAGG